MATLSTIPEELTLKDTKGPTTPTPRQIEVAPDTIARAHAMPFGATLQPDGRVLFRLWAPAAESIAVALEPDGPTLPLESKPEGWHELLTGEAREGTLYRFVLPDGLKVPDPASRFQPQDVHGPSEVIDPAAFPWHDASWSNRPWAEAVLYELHIGTFTEPGTFLAAIEKLDHLVDLGITGIEIMPIADFAGRWNWGYDGVLPYAPDSSYGRPEDLKALVQAAHARGLMVLLDVVYNHFGPDGNFLSTYAPQIFTKHHKTPWGDAVNFDDHGSETVREFIVHNALYWIEEFHLDGLRLDAVHAIKDDSDTHLLTELAGRARAVRPGYPVHLVLENEDNQVRRLTRDPDNRPLQYTAQWNDDMHHVLHTAATLESNGYYKEYLHDQQKLGQALAEGFAFQGQVMECRGCERGEPSAGLPPTAFVAFMQNHDQIGNRAFGERINAIASPEAVHAIAAVYLLLPQIPMLFMGEEWGSSQPFPYFCDFEGELGDLVRQGRRDEFASFPEFKDPEKRDRIPDPQAEQTFRSGKLDWAQATQDPHAEWCAWYRRILAVRRQDIVPILPLIGGFAGHFELVATGAVHILWNLADGRTLTLCANLSNDSVEGFPVPRGRVLWHEGTPRTDQCMRPWSVRWALIEDTE